MRCAGGRRACTPCRTHAEDERASGSGAAGRRRSVSSPCGTLVPRAQQQEQLELGPPQRWAPRGRPLRAPAASPRPASGHVGQGTAGEDNPGHFAGPRQGRRGLGAPAQARPAGPRPHDGDGRGGPHMPSDRPAGARQDLSTRARGRLVRHWGPGKGIRRSRAASRYADGSGRPSRRAPRAPRIRFGSRALSVPRPARTFPPLAASGGRLAFRRRRRARRGAAFSL